MPSQAVLDATGQSPEVSADRKSAVELLTEKRGALDAARERYKRAKEARDEQVMATEGHVIDALRQMLPELEAEAKAEEEARAREQAERRMVGIRKAYGAVQSEYREDDQRVEQARRALADAITKRNARAKKLEAYQIEASALADRFTFPNPKFEMMSEPQHIELPRQWRTSARRPDIEETRDGTRRTRRTYAEASGSEGYEIIQRAGLRDFRRLMPAEEEFLKEKQNRQPDAELAQAALEANALGNLGVPAGAILRG